jgi:hypothetical protein
MTTTHWHVTRHNDDDPFVTEDLFSALDYAATELDILAENEYEYTSAIAERVNNRDDDVSPYEMAEALRSFARSETYGNLQANAANMVKQHDAPLDERAPLYRETWQANPGTSPQQRLDEAAHNVATQINNESPLSIWPCTANACTTDND